MPDKDKLKEEDFILAQSLRLQSRMVWKAWQQEHEAAAHMASTVRKQREMNTGAQLSFSPFCSAQDPSPLKGVIHS
ncbi:hypothetical protein I79_005511 [Cricetulus griseus]|uniref:Uncharacterized protein n=1 Tax=Cricetulus griseus TaxID=10029 RepID=G3H5E7_CRIGR|nr:hypothetical protein I79_005511 [Cricetulus griseus]